MTAETKQALELEATKEGLAYVDSINRGESPWTDSDMELAYEDGMIAGAKWMYERLIEDATEVTVHIEAGNYPYIPQLELYDYDKDIPLAKEGDKYKVVLIKEE